MAVAGGRTPRRPRRLGGDRDVGDGPAPDHERVEHRADRERGGGLPRGDEEENEQRSPAKILDPTAARAATDLAESRYAGGRYDVLAVLESQRTQLNADIELIDARRERVAARVDLYLALGGGFEAGAAFPGLEPDPAVAEGEGARS